MEKHIGKQQLEGSGRGKDNIEMDLREMDCVSGRQMELFWHVIQ
jgi:hypothetical protein